MLDLAVLADGDLRRALNSLEVIALGLPEGAAITPAELETFARERRIRYDADEDEHHDTISAYIKSCRGCDPDAALYWLAKMLAGGEDPRFIARRLVILASEDIGLADPQALPLTVAAHHAVDFVGLPEAELTLAHATLYVAAAPRATRPPWPSRPPTANSRSGRFSPCPRFSARRAARRIAGWGRAPAMITPTISRRTSPARSTSSGP